MIVINLIHLRYFAKLAHEQHYTRAAEKLCITQPSLSNAILQLENELGVQLFEKTGRKTCLTSFGQQFLECVENSLAILDEGIDTLQRSAAGDGLIRLGLLRTLGVNYIPQLVKSFLHEFSDKNIDFTFTTDVTGKLIDGLEEGKFDVIFSSKPADNPNFQAHKIGTQDLVLIVPKTHPLAPKPFIDIRETMEYPYIFFKKTSGLRHSVDKIFNQLDTQPHIAYEIDEDQVIAGMVANDFGIAVVPYMDMLLGLNVKIIQITYPVWDRNFYMLTKKDSYKSPAVENFIEYVKKKPLHKY